MTFIDIASLSKCCFALVFFFTLLNPGTAQNVISVKKKPDTAKVETPIEEPETEEIEIELRGFYYSKPFTLSAGTPGEPPIDFRRLIVYVDEYDKVYIFHSTKSIKKLYEKFAKDPKKLTEEYGSIELTDYGEIYISSKTIYASSQANGYDTYKYVGNLVSEHSFYIEYRASYKKKVGLNIYLHKY